MRWLAPTEKDTATVTRGKRLWDATDQFHASSWLKPQEYSGLTIGPILVRFAERLCRRRPHGHELCHKWVYP